MQISDLNAGRYPCKIVDWGLEEVEKIRQLKVTVQVELEVDGDSLQMKWDGFLLKKDGSPNMKTIETLKQCGFTGANVNELITNPMALDKDKELFATVIEDGQYKRIEWLNDSSSGAMNKIDDVQKTRGYDLSKVNSLFKQTATPTQKLKNYAPNADNSGFDDGEKLPF